MEIGQAIRELHDDDLFQYLQEEGNSEMVMQMCKTPKYYLHSSTCTTLQLAIRLEKSIGTILRLVKIGGKHLVMKEDEKGATPLHYACQNRNISTTVILKLLEVGGSDLIMKKGKYNHTALHYLCDNKNSSAELVSKFIEVGGKHLLKQKDAFGDSAFHYACRNENITSAIMLKIIDVGGKDLIMQKDRYGHTLFHYALTNTNLSSEVTLKLIDVGGHDLIMQKDIDGHTPFRNAFRYEHVSIQVILKLIDVGGQQMFDHVHERHLRPFYQEMSMAWKSKINVLYILFSDSADNVYQNYGISYGVLADIINEGIQVNIGGEFEAGGLFCMSSTQAQHDVYKRWEEFFPYLESRITETSFRQGQKPPLLHAAIIARAPSNVLQSIIKCLDYNILKKDSQNRLPIHVAIDVGLEWGQMKLVAYANVNEVINGADALTGLHCFMTAAASDGRCNLSSIYGLMRISPKTIDNESILRQNKIGKII